MNDQERFPLRWAHFPHLDFPIRQDAVMAFHYFEAARFFDDKGWKDQAERWRAIGRHREHADKVRMEEAA